jgi:hypothetical protein
VAFPDWLPVREVKGKIRTANKENGPGRSNDQKINRLLIENY